MSHSIKKIFKFIAGILVSFMLLIVVYFLFAIVLSVIPVNQNQVVSNEMDIYIKSNGVHLEIVLPLKTETKDWTQKISMDHQIMENARYISFGWGDRNFYRYTPQWSDLTFPTAFRALFLKSSSAIHVDYYKSLTTNKRCKKISISDQQYQAIVDFIEAGFQRDSNNNLLVIEDLHYSEMDAFYEAKRSYNLFFTCNTWTNRCLKQAGLKASLWTPFDKGTLFHYRKQ